MKIKTWVEIAQTMDVEVSLDDIMDEIAGLEEPQRTNEAMRLLSICMTSVMKVPDAIVAGMTDQQRKVVANIMWEQAVRYIPAKPMIPPKEENPNGLHLRFKLERTDGKPIPPYAEYFVLRLDDGGSDPAHIDASRKAILTYAKEIEPHIPKLAADLQSRYSKQFG